MYSHTWCDLCWSKNSWIMTMSAYFPTILVFKSERMTLRLRDTNYMWHTQGTVYTIWIPNCQLHWVFYFLTHYSTVAMNSQTLSLTHSCRSVHETLLQFASHLQTTCRVGRPTVLSMLNSIQFMTEYPYAQSLPSSNLNGLFCLWCKNGLWKAEFCFCPLATSVGWDMHTCSHYIVVSLSC